MAMRMRNPTSQMAGSKLAFAPLARRNMSSSRAPARSSTVAKYSKYEAEAPEL